MMDFIWSIDLYLLRWINQSHTSAWGDRFFPWITDLHKNPWFFSILIPLLIFVFIRKFQRAGITYFIFLLLTMACNDFVGGRIKRLVERPRPFENIEAAAIRKSPASEKTSFPSNHASNNFAFAAYVTVFFPQAKIAVFTIAAVISYSRVYNGVHYPTDIFVGALLGLLIGYVFSRLSKKIVATLQHRAKQV